MSPMNKNYNNSSGTTSRSFQIGKNRLIVDNEDDGILKFSLRDSTGTITQWKLNSDDNMIEFPTGDTIKIDKNTKEVLISLGVSKLIIGADIPSPDDEENFNEEKLSESVPNTWAVWEIITSIISPLNDRMDQFESRLSTVELALGIIPE